MLWLCGQDSRDDKCLQCCGKKAIKNTHLKYRTACGSKTLKWILQNGWVRNVDWIKSASCPVQTLLLVVLTLWSLLPKCYGVQSVCSFVSVDLNSNDSYGTVVNLGLEQDGSSPHSAGSRAPHFTLHGGPATPPYLSSSHSPTPPHPALGPNFPYSTGEGLAVYTTLGKSHIWLCDVIS